MWAKVRELSERVRSLIDELRPRVERTLLWRIWERALENEFIDRSVALGAKAFVSLFPALLVVAAFMPPSVQNSITQTVAHRAGLSGDGLESVRGAFTTSNDLRRATGVLGLLFTFFYVSSFTGALRRVYTKAWRRPPSSQLSARAIGASWLLGIAIYAAILGVIRRVLIGGPKTALFGVVASAGAIGLWWVTSWLMMQREVRLRALSATAIITGGALSLYALSAAVWMPRVVESNQRQFGFFGVTLALVTWLTGAATVIVVSACAGAVLAEDDGFIGRLVRGASPSILEDNARAPLPPPMRAPTFSTALGLRRDDGDGDDPSGTRHGDDESGVTTSG